MGDDESDNENKKDMGVVVIGDLIFIIGGWNGRGVEEEVEVMNTKTQTMGNIDKNSNKEEVEWELEWLMIVSSGHLGGFDDVMIKLLM